MRLAAALVVVAACESRPPIASCEVNLHGVYVTPSGARWMLLDNGATLEAFALFEDLVPEGAPRLIDLKRDGGKLTGHLKRRFVRRAQTCDARAPLTVTACKDDALQVVLGDVAAPLQYEPCTWPQQAPSRVETWKRE